MILTGYSALNKLLGKEVYTSQDQLGGPQVDHHHAVTKPARTHPLLCYDIHTTHQQT